MNKVTNLRNLFLHQIRHLMDGEKKQLNTLPVFVEKATSIELKKLIGLHLEETHTQIERLENIFKSLNEQAGSNKCKAMKGLIDEGIELALLSTDPDVRDAGIVASVQHINHCEIAGYGTATSFANILGLYDLADLLHESLDEEKKADKDLSNLAESNINSKAKNPVFA